MPRYLMCADIGTDADVNHSQYMNRWLSAAREGLTTGCGTIGIQGEWEMTLLAWLDDVNESGEPVLWTLIDADRPLDMDRHHGINVGAAVMYSKAIMEVTE